MKQFFTLFALCLSFQLAFAQVSITEAPDFTLTDIHGEEHHLYDLLDDGKYVMIKLYAYWCGPCCSTAPAVKEVYENFGCNSGNLVVIGLEADGTLAQTEAFENDCGAAGGFPVVSGLDGGASAVVDQFNPLAFPTVILVAPDRTIVEQDIWPFEVDGATALVEGYGPAQQECAPVSTADVALIAGFEAHGKFTPRYPACIYNSCPVSTVFRQLPLFTIYFSLHLKSEASPGGFPKRHHTNTKTLHAVQP